MEEEKRGGRSKRRNQRGETDAKKRDSKGREARGAIYLQFYVVLLWFSREWDAVEFKRQILFYSKYSWWRLYFWLNSMRDTTANAQQKYANNCDH